MATSNVVRERVVISRLINVNVLAALKQDLTELCDRLIQPVTVNVKVQQHVGATVVDQSCPLSVKFVLLPKKFKNHLSETDCGFADFLIKHAQWSAVYKHSCAVPPGTNRDDFVKAIIRDITNLYTELHNDAERTVARLVELQVLVMMPYTAFQADKFIKEVDELIAKIQAASVTMPDGPDVHAAGGGGAARNQSRHHAPPQQRANANSVPDWRNYFEIFNVILFEKNDFGSKLENILFWMEREQWKTASYAEMLAFVSMYIKPLEPWMSRLLQSPYTNYAPEICLRQYINKRIWSFLNAVRSGFQPVVQDHETIQDFMRRYDSFDECSWALETTSSRAINLTPAATQRLLTNNNADTLFTFEDVMVNQMLILPTSSLLANFTKHHRYAREDDMVNASRHVSDMVTKLTRMYQDIFKGRYTSAKSQKDPTIVTKNVADILRSHVWDLRMVLRALCALGLKYPTITTPERKLLHTNSPMFIMAKATAKPSLLEKVEVWFKSGYCDTPFPGHRLPRHVGLLNHYIDDVKKYLNKMTLSDFKAVSIALDMVRVAMMPSKTKETKAKEDPPAASAASAASSSQMSSQTSVQQTLSLIFDEVIHMWHVVYGASSDPSAKFNQPADQVDDDDEDQDNSRITNVSEAFGLGTGQRKLPDFATFQSEWNALYARFKDLYSGVGVASS